MKKWLMFAVAVLAAGQLLAGPFGVGMKELALVSSMGNELDDYMATDLLLGYAPIANLEVGLKIGMSKYDASEGGNFGVFSEYNLANKTRVTPFVGLGVNYNDATVTEIASTEAAPAIAVSGPTPVLTSIARGSAGYTPPTEEPVTPPEPGSPAGTGGATMEEQGASTKTITHSDSVVVEARAGVKCEIAAGISLSIAYVYAWASDDIYGDKDDIEDSVQRVEAGVRWGF